MNAICTVAALNPWFAFIIAAFLVGAIWHLAAQWTRYMEGFSE